MKALIKFDANWCDEFDCQQFEIVDTLKTADLYIEEILEQGMTGFGTNQEFVDLDRSDFKIFLIDDEFAKSIEEILGKRFGTGVL